MFLILVHWIFEAVGLRFSVEWKAIKKNKEIQKGPILALVVLIISLGFRSCHELDLEQYKDHVHAVVSVLSQAEWQTFSERAALATKNVSAFDAIMSGIDIGAELGKEKPK